MIPGFLPRRDPHAPPHTSQTSAVLKHEDPFFVKDSPEGQPPVTTYRQPPPTATNRQLPTATNRHQPPNARSSWAIARASAGLVMATVHQPCALCLTVSTIPSTTVSQMDWRLSKNSTVPLSKGTHTSHSPFPPERTWQVAHVFAGLLPGRFLVDGILVAKRGPPSLQPPSLTLQPPLVTFLPPLFTLQLPSDTLQPPLVNPQPPPVLLQPLSLTLLLPPNHHRSPSNRPWVPSNCCRLPFSRHRLPSGAPLSPVDYRPKAVSHPAKAVGFPPTPISYPATTVSYPPTSICCPPTDI